MAELQAADEFSEFSGAESLLQTLPDCRMQFLGTPQPAGELAEKLTAEQSDKNRSLPLLQRESGGFTLGEGVLQIRKCGHEVFLPVHRMRDRIDEALEADVQRHGGEMELRGFRESIARCGHGDRACERLPGPVAVETKFHAVGFSRFLHRHIPVARLKGHLDFLHDAARFIFHAQMAWAAGMPRDVDIPIGEKPIWILGHEENHIHPVAVGQRAEGVQIHFRRGFFARSAFGRDFLGGLSGGLGLSGG